MDFDTFMEQRRAGKDRQKRSIYALPNKEGEIYTVDLSAPGCPFEGPIWERILGAAQDQDELLPAVATLRQRDSTGRFAGYAVSFGHGITAFMPRSRSGYYFDENRDATGKRLAVKVLSVEPAGPYTGNVIVESASLHRKGDGIFSPLRCGDRLWGLAVDLLEGARLLLELPGRRFGVARATEAHALTGRYHKEALTGRFYRLEVLPTEPRESLLFRHGAHDVNLIETQRD